MAEPALGADQQIADKFKAIRELTIYGQNHDGIGEEVAKMWEDIGAIRDYAKEILRLLGAATGEEPEADRILRLEDLKTVLGVFSAIYSCARDAADPAARPNWRAAAGHIVSASRRAEELLQPIVFVEVFPEELHSDAAESVAFTHPTAQSHPRVTVEGSVTAVTWSETDMRTQGSAEALDLPEVVAGGETEAKLQALEHQLLELKSSGRHEDYPNIAETPHALGLSLADLTAGGLVSAKQCLEAYLCTLRSSHTETRDIALHTLGLVNLLARDLDPGKKQLEESLHMMRSLHQHLSHRASDGPHDGGNRKTKFELYFETLDALMRPVLTRGPASDSVIEVISEICSWWDKHAQQNLDEALSSFLEDFA